MSGKTADRYFRIDVAIVRARKVRFERGEAAKETQGGMARGGRSDMDERFGEGAEGGIWEGTECDGVRCVSAGWNGRSEAQLWDSAVGDGWGRV